MEFVAINPPDRNDLFYVFANTTRDMMPGIGTFELYFHRKLGHKVVKIMSNDGVAEWGFFRIKG